jgi:hypothetical protein
MVALVIPDTWEICMKFLQKIKNPRDSGSRNRKIMCLRPFLAKLEEIWS